MESSLLLRAAEPGVTIAPVVDGQEQGDLGRETWIVCAQCLARITTESARIALAGSHRHTFTNPHGLRFEIGCFAEVCGVTCVGPSSDYWSWFSGYAWRIEICRACHHHLGWRFESSEHAFHGLILTRLAERGGEA